MYKYVFENIKCAEFTINDSEKKGYLLFSKTEVPTLPAKTEYNFVTVELHYEDETVGWTQVREWHFTKVRMISIGQDEATWTATFEYKDATELKRMA